MCENNNSNISFQKNMLAYCGIYCGQCSARTAFLEQDMKHLESIPALYKKPRQNLADFDCEGCKGRNICGPCKIKDCAVGKRLESCADCADFPCAILAAFAGDGFPHHRQALENLQAIRQIGIDEWFRKLDPPLYCSCGKRQSWYVVCENHGGTGQAGE